MKMTQNGSIEEKSAAQSPGQQASVEAILTENLLMTVRSSVETIRKEAKADIERRLDCMTEQLVDEIRRITNGNKEFAALFQNGETPQVKRPRTDKHRLPEKQFETRNSLLTDLFRVKHIRTIYHIFVVVMFLTFLNTIVHDLAVDGSINLGLKPFLSGFGKFHISLALWAGMHVISSFLYFAFIGWANTKGHLAKHSSVTRAWDTFGITSFFVYQIGFFYVVTKLVLHYDLPHASSLSVVMEMTRFVMKTYAFVRENAPKVHRFKEKSDDEKLLVKMPTFSWYQYFLFCPTLIYRDSYPRTSSIRWKTVLAYLVEMLAVIMFLSFIFERFAMPYFGKFGESEATMGSLVMSIFGCIIPGITIFMCGFYSFLHVWLNLWAEMLRFGDRKFYSDWWTAISFDVYYRKWNVVVHDWLYTYVYKDLYERVSVSKKVAAVAVFTISALIHEYILAFSFRFFYPVMFVLFEGFGLLMMFLPIHKFNSLGNIILWTALCLGNGIQVALYTIEYFARRNCNVGQSLADYMVPVSWSCHNVTMNSDWEIKFSFT